MVKKRNAIVYMVNRNYDFLFGVCLINIKKTNQKYDNIIVYHDCFTDEEIKKFQLIEPKAEFRFYSLEDFYEENQLSENPQNQKYLARFSHLTAVRIRKILELLREYKSVLYLDLDTLILDDISECFQLTGAMCVSAGNRDFAAYAKESIENFEKKYPNFLNTIDKKLETYIGHPNAGVLYFEESIPYEIMILECKKWLKLHWNDSKLSIWTFDEILLLYLFLKFKVKPNLIDKFNVRLSVTKLNIDSKILHNYSPDNNTKIWNNMFSLLLFPQWQDYYIESVKVTGMKCREQEFLEPCRIDRKNIILQLMMKDFWINLLPHFKIPEKLKLTNDFTKKYLHLYTIYPSIYYELKYDNPIYSKEKSIYVQLIVKSNNNEIFLNLKKLQEIFHKIIISVENKGWIIVKSKSVDKKQEIQELFDFFFQITLPIIEAFKVMY